jgi:hypothetical protein
METDSDNTKRWGPYRGEGVRTVKRCRGSQAPLPGRRVGLTHFLRYSHITTVALSRSDPAYFKMSGID